MVEANKIGNPFDEDNFTGGGGLWHDKIVTITSVKAILDPMTRGDGTPVLGDDGKQVVKNVLEIRGMADDLEFERRETYSAGQLIPTPDGGGFVKPDGTPSAFNKNCDAAKFSRYLKASGFDISKLWDAENQRTVFGALVGAQFIWKAEPQLDKNGQVKKNKKGYDLEKYYPFEFKGMKPGVGDVQNSTPSAALAEKAEAAVLAVLGEQGGKATRAELIRKLAAKLAGDADGNKVVALIAKADFHVGKPWKVDGTGYSL